MFSLSDARFTPEHLQLLSTRTLKSAAEDPSDGDRSPVVQRLAQREIRHRRAEACPRAETQHARQSPA